MSPRGCIALLLAATFVGVVSPTEGAKPQAVTAPSTVHARAAATCSDFANQQAAQNAANTRDADGDGIYCEDLPCPCSPQWHAQHDGGGGGGSNPSPTPPKTRPHLGRSVPFHRPTRTTRCHLRDHGRLPDPACTPGAYYTGATRKLICQPGYSRSVRHTSEATKETVYRAYGIEHHSRATYEMDHLVPLEAGGADTKGPANLFPEAARPRPGFREKDKLENWAHDSICSGGLPLRSTQRRIADNWLAVYRVAF